MSKSATLSSSERSSINIRRERNGDELPKSQQRSSRASAHGKSESSRAFDTSRSTSVSTSKSESTCPNANVDRQSQRSSTRPRENAIQPFTFLNIFDDKTWNANFPTERIEPTDIDLQLAALTRRVQLNKSLLERTNERVKEINFLVERNAVKASKEFHNGKEESKCIGAAGDELINNESSLNIACPGMMELKRTINVTKDMLTYVKKICNNEIDMKDLPEELIDHMNSRGSLSQTEDTDSRKRDGIRTKISPVK